MSKYFQKQLNEETAWTRKMRRALGTGDQSPGSGVKSSASEACRLLVLGFPFRSKWQGQSPEAGSMLAASESEQTLRGRIRGGRLKLGKTWGTGGHTVYLQISKRTSWGNKGGTYFLGLDWGWEW